MVYYSALGPMTAVAAVGCVGEDMYFLVK